MSAVRDDAVHRPPVPAPVLRPIAVDMLDELLAIEVQAYTFPWTRGNFIDSLSQGHLMHALFAPGSGPGRMMGYFVAMPGVDEMHLLNITVARAHEGRGHARAMLSTLYALCRLHRAGALWLEVRESNDRARALYRREGFAEAGRRRGYYPAPQGRREDAILMTRGVELGGDE